MHKSLYASGFLYNISTEQILLQQLHSQSTWSLFGGKNNPSETPQHAFQEIITKHLHITPPLSVIHTVYEYPLENSGEQHVILYANVNFSEEEQQFAEELHTNWFTFRQLYKLSLTEQTKQDLMIGQRVIQAEIRKKEALQTPSQ
jgi:ADP-ribose pyrophosphatase YjhB (NUDIX family)